MNVHGPTMNHIYPRLYTSIKALGKDVASTRERTNVRIELAHPEKCLATCRNISLSYLIGELTWYIMQRNDLAFISKFSSFWQRLSDDGVTVNSAYGYIIHRLFKFDQLELAIDILERDPDSRRAIINISTPNVYRSITHDEPCTESLQFYVREGRLHCTTVMRSNDLWFGLPYDVAYFTTLQRYVAFCLGLPLGSYTHFATSMHYYHRDTLKLENLSTPSAIHFDGLKLWSLAPYFENFVLSYSGPDLKRAIIDFAYDQGVLS